MHYILDTSRNQETNYAYIISKISILMLYDHLPSTMMLEISVKHYKASEIVTV